MPDIVSPQTRSRMMSGIRSANTQPERVIRTGLHRMGFRYRLRGAGIVGKPDIVFAKYRAAVFVHGCFWHGHDCPLFRLPDTRREFWREKIAGNRKRDAVVRRGLAEAGWRQLTVWECAFRGRQSPGVEDTVARIAAWLVSDDDRREIRGHCGGAG